MRWKPSSCHLALLCSPQGRRWWRQLPDALLGRDRACIWYWVNLMKIEKERHLGFLFSHILNHICRGSTNMVSFSVRYADLGAYFSSTISQGPSGILFFCLSTLLSFFIYFIITWLRWGPCLCSRSLLFFSGLNRKHIVCLFTLLQVLRWCQFRYLVALNRVTCSMILTPDVVFITSFGLLSRTLTWKWSDC